MKKIVSIFLSLIFVISVGIPVYAYEGISDIVSETWCVMNAETGQVLISNEPDKRMEPASITKILTCAIALEYLDPDESYTFSREAASYEQGSTHLAMVEGETVKINDLLYGAMVESANDCAMGLADAVSGSQREFMLLMNEKLREIGCTNTHFANSTGMPDANHYTTARDMGLITRYAMSVEGFDKYFSAWEWTIPETNKNGERKFGTHHAMIVGPENNASFGYEGAYGGKLGWTEEAEHTMVTAAEKDGMNVICIVMKSKQKYSKYKDTKKLLDYVFSKFTVSEIPVAVQKSEIAIYNQDEKYGKMTVYPMASINVLLTDDMDKSSVTVTTNIPQSCDITEIGKVALTVAFSKSTDSMDTTAFSIMPTNYIAKESAVLDGESTVLTDKKQNAVYTWWLFIVIPLVVILFLVAIVLIIRAYNIRKYRKIQKHRHYKRLNHE